MGVRFEVVVVEDGSPDGTGEVAESLGRKYRNEVGGVETEIIKILKRKVRGVQGQVLSRQVLSLLVLSRRVLSRLVLLLNER